MRKWFSVLVGQAWLLGCGLNSPPQVGFDCAQQAAVVSVTGLVRVKHPIKDRYIVVMKPVLGVNGVALRGAASVSAAQSFAAGYPTLRGVKAFQHGFSATVDAQTLKSLLAHPSVKYVQQEGTKSVPPEKPRQKIGAAVPWGLDRSDQRDLPRDGKYEPGSDGAKVHAYIIDTGLEEGHVEFTGRVGEGFSSFGGEPTDGHGHGSHVAGTVAGTTFGIAKKATVHGVRVLDAQGQGTDSDVIRGIDWVSQHVTRNGWPAVANMSLGGDASPALDEAVCRAIAAGVSFAIAAGNDGLGACQYSPARVVQAITVGASDKSDDTADFSNEGPCVSLFAPGVDVESIGGQMSGTSMASPHAAGAAALCLSRHPGAPESVKKCVVDSATPDKLSGVTSGTPNKLLYVKEPQE